MAKCFGPDPVRVNGMLTLDQVCRERVSENKVGREKLFVGRK